MVVLAAAGSYSRVYVAVHYPTDVLAGVGLWVACGWIEARCVVGTGSRLGDRAVRGKRAALVKRFRTVQYLDSKKQPGADETGNVRGAGYALRGLENLPIRWRLTLLNAVMIGVILLTLAGSFVWLWYEQLVDQVDNTTRIRAMEAATALEEGED